MPSASDLRPIIIVEDSDEDFDAVRGSGILAEVRRSTTGDESLAILPGAVAVRPAVVLMDLNTPETDGLEALAAIKSDPALKAYPVVIFRTSADPRDLASCHAAGANADQVKPVRYPDHLRIITDLLNYRLGRVTLPPPGGTKP